MPKKKKLVRGRDFNGWTIKDYYRNKWYFSADVLETRAEARRVVRSCYFVPTKIVRVKFVEIDDNGNPVL